MERFSRETIDFGEETKERERERQTDRKKERKKGKRAERSRQNLK